MDRDLRLTIMRRRTKQSHPREVMTSDDPDPDKCMIRPAKEDGARFLVERLLAARDGKRTRCKWMPVQKSSALLCCLDAYRATSD